MNLSNYYKILPINVEDAENLHAFLVKNNEQFSKYFPVTVSLNKTPVQTSKYVEECVKDFSAKTLYVFVIKEIVSEKIIGLLILKKIDWIKLAGEFAFCIDKNFEGNGITSWGVSEMINFATGSLGLKTLKIIAHKLNLGSCAVAKKNGFVWQETLKNEFKPIGQEPKNMELFILKA